jgi:Flp pilus assembly protein TadG
VEFAATASLLLLLLFGIVVYRVHFVARAAITQAASEGARAAVVGLGTEERSALAMAAATATLSRYGAFVGQALTSVRTATGDGGPPRRRRGRRAAARRDGVGGPVAP